MKRLLVVLVLAAAAIAVLPASASTFLAMDQGELVAASQAVVVGEVLGVRAFWNDDATAIVSEAQVRVDEVIAGEAPSIVTVRTFGGTVGQITVEAHGFPSFFRGERLVLYLDGVGGAANVVGYQLGEYRVRVRNGAEIAVPSVDDGAHFVHRDGRAAARPVALPLSELKHQIREAARQRPTADLRDVR